jgi:chemotaxis protein MotA
VKQVFREIPGLFRRADDHTPRDILQLLKFARNYRYGSVRAAEREIAAMHSDFLKTSLQRVVDGDAPEQVLKAMQWRITAQRNYAQGKIQILHSMSVFAPAFGMLGTLFGLVHMLAGLGNSGLEEIGGSMAFAMMTTVYGIILANLVFKPLAIKMERRLMQRLLHLNALKEGIIQISQKQHPALIKDALEAFYGQHEAGGMPVPQLSLVRGA